MKTLIDRLASHANKVDVEIGGQKVSVALAERVVDDPIRTAVNAPSERNSIAEIKADSTMLLEILSDLDTNDTVLLQQVDRYGRPATAGSPGLQNLVRLGLLHQTARDIEITKLGRRVLSLVGDSDPQEALHKITYSM